MANASKRPARPFLASIPNPTLFDAEPMIDWNNSDPAISLQLDAYSMHGGNADPGWPLGYPCIHPKCGSFAPVFPNETALDEHMKQHFSLFSTQVNGFASANDSILTNAYNDVVTAKGPPSGPVMNDYSSSNGVFDLSPPSSTMTVVRSPSINYPVVNNSPLTSSYADQRHQCPHPGCDVSVKSIRDLARHTRKHEGGPKQFDCPMRDCPRHGEQGFARKDKLNDHLKAKHKLSRV